MHRDCYRSWNVMLYSRFVVYCFQDLSLPTLLWRFRRCGFCKHLYAFHRTDFSVCSVYNTSLRFFCGTHFQSLQSAFESKRLSLLLFAIVKAGAAWFCFRTRKKEQILFENQFQACLDPNIYMTQVYTCYGNTVLFWYFSLPFFTTCFGPPGHHQVSHKH
jgi:hypothetical protein